MRNEENEWNAYNLDYAKDHEKKNPGDHWEFKAIFKLYKPKSADKILEIGCNTGEFCNLIKEKYNSEVYGIDINKDAINVAIDKYPNLNFEAMDLFDIKGKYDVIYMQHVIEHIEEPEKALIKLKRDNLNKNGKLIISCPNKWAYLLKLSLWLKGDKFCYDPTHFHEFSPLVLSKILKNSGYSKIKIFTKPLGLPFVFKFSSNLYYSFPAGVFGANIFLVSQI